jgi:hypothetical protein
MTVTAPVLEKITEVVTEWVGEGKMFTAFEVSLAVKERGVRERHRNLREDVHAVIFRVGGPGGYTRTLMDVGAPEQAWVYHPLRANPYTYRPLDRSGYDDPADVPYVVPGGLRNPVRLAAGTARPHAVPDGAYGTDQRGRVCIPVTLLARLGVSRGQRVDVLCDAAGEQVLITKPSATPGAEGGPFFLPPPPGGREPDRTNRICPRGAGRSSSCWRSRGASHTIMGSRALQPSCGA